MMNAPTVFLAYAREDAYLANQLTKQLSDLGLHVWRDLDILPGQEWSYVIREAISRSDAFVVLIGDSFYDSRALTLELGAFLSARGREGRATVIPILAGSVEVADLPSDLASFQVLQMSDTSIEEAVEAVAHSIQSAAKHDPSGKHESVTIPWRQSEADRMEKAAREIAVKEKRRKLLFTITMGVLVTLTTLAALAAILAGYANDQAVMARFKAEQQLKLAILEEDEIRRELGTIATADLSGANLTGIDLSGVTLRGANLNQVQLTAARIVNSDLRSSTLEFANLSAADLSGTDLRFSNLNGANLTDANLTGVILEGATMNGANLSGVFGVEPAQLDLVCGNSRTILPAGLNVPSCSPDEN